MRPRNLIIFLLLWLATPIAIAQARLTLGAAPESTPGLASEENAERLSVALGKALGEEIVLRVFHTREDLDQWLLRFTMLDLAIYDAAFLAKHPGKYLVIGAADDAAKLFIASRQGVVGDLPQRVAKALQHPLTGLKGKTASSQEDKGAIPRPPKPGVPSSGLRPSVPMQEPPSPEFKTEPSAAFSKPEIQPPVPVTEPQTVSPPQAKSPSKTETSRPPAPNQPTAVKGSSDVLPLVLPPPPLIFPELPPVLETPLPPMTEAAPVKAPRAPAPKPVPPVVAAAEKPAEPAPAKTEPPAAPAAEPPVKAEASVAVPTAVEPPLKDVPAVAAPAPQLAAVAEKPAEPTPVVVAEKPAEPVKPAKKIKPLKPVEPPPAVTAEPAPPVVAAAEKPPETAPAKTEPPVKAEAPVAVPTAVEPPLKDVPAPAPVTEPQPKVAEKPAEPVKTAKKIKPLKPVEPPPAVKAEPAPPVVAAAEKPAETAPAKTEPPAAPAAEPPVKAEAPVAVPTTVEPPVKTVAVDRTQPAGIAAQSTVQPQKHPETPVNAEVPEVIAQPDIPQGLRPPGVPVTRPTKLPAAPLPKDDLKPLLVSKLPEKIGRTQKREPLLPPPDPEPGIVYVVPFITLMVPNEVRERIFDQFVDKLNESGANRKLRFVILKESLEKIDRDWLNARKYVFGEVFGYVEDSGCCSTDLRAKARLTYYKANHPDPSLRYEYPVRTFFDHNKSDIATERRRLADQIANALVSELTKVLKP